MIGMGKIRWFLLLVVMGMAFIACTPAQIEQAAPTSQPVVEVDDSTVSASAEVVPERWINLSFSQGGKILKIMVEPGDRVEADLVLARVDDRALQAAIVQAEAGVKRAELARKQLADLPDEAAIAAAKAALVSAEANYDRLDRSGARDIELDAAQAQIDSVKVSLNLAQRSADRIQIEAASADLEAAGAALEQAQQALEETELRAPFAAEVVEVYGNPGEFASPGQPLFLLANTAELRVETVDLSEVDAIRVKTGDRATVYFDALANTSVQGTVTWIASKALPGSAVNYTVRILLEEIPPELRWGMSAFVVIQVK